MCYRAICRIAVYYRATCKIAISYLAIYKIEIYLCAICKKGISYCWICRVGVSYGANCRIVTLYRAVYRVWACYRAISMIGFSYRAICKVGVCYRAIGISYRAICLLKTFWQKKQRDVSNGRSNFLKSYLWWFRNLACGDLIGTNGIEKNLVHGPPRLVWGKGLVWLSMKEVLIWSRREAEGLVLIFLSFAVL